MAHEACHAVHRDAGTVWRILLARGTCGRPVATDMGRVQMATGGKKGTSSKKGVSHKKDSSDVEGHGGKKGVSHKKGVSQEGLA